MVVVAVGDQGEFVDGQADREQRLRFGEIISRGVHSSRIQVKTVRLLVRRGGPVPPDSLNRGRRVGLGPFIEPGQAGAGLGEGLFVAVDLAHNVICKLNKDRIFESGRLAGRSGKGCCRQKAADARCF